MKGKCLLAALLVAAMGHFPSVAGQSVTTPEPMTAVMEGRLLFENAWQGYYEARKALAELQRGEAYAKAIAGISLAATLEPENVDILLLASQIYRGKGGISYAKDYFAKAEKILLARIEDNPEDIGALLDYAIICRAGDARYWPNAKEYQGKAEKAADQVIKLCRRTGGSQEMGRVMRAAAVAYLVKGDTKRADRILKKVSTRDATNKFYYGLYESTVKKGEWLWPTKAVANEFLLYCLADSSRNASLQ